MLCTIISVEPKTPYTDINEFPPYFQIEELCPEIAGIQINNEECHIGTLGALSKYDAWFNINGDELYYLYYLQFESKSNYLCDKVKDQYLPSNVTSNSSDSVILYTDNEKMYIIESGNTLIIIETNLEIKSDTLMSYHSF